MWGGGQTGSMNGVRQKTMSEQHPDPERYWKHRRRGYYAGIWWAIAQTPMWVAIELKNPGTLEALTAVVGWSYAISGTLIVSYYGGNIAQDVAKAKWGR